MSECGNQTHGETPTETTNTSIPIGLFRGLLSRGGPQTKKLAYLAGIAAAIVWLTLGIWIPIRAEWNVAFALFLGAITTGYVGGKKVGAAVPPAPGVRASASDSTPEGAKIGGQS